MIKVFTYGSLMRGMRNHRVMTEAGGRFIKEAKINGRMRAYCPAFPGVAEPSEKVVVGEVYEVSEAGLWALDRLESEGSFYHRRTITTLAGDEVQAYFLNPDQMHGPLVDSGDWRAYCDGKPDATGKRNPRPNYDQVTLGNGAQFWWEEG